MSSIPVWTPSVTASTPAPVAPLVATRLTLPPLLAKSRRLRPAPNPARPNVATSATVSMAPAAKPPTATRPRFTSSREPPSAIACSPACPYIPPSDCPTDCVPTPATEPIPAAVTLSPILSLRRSVTWFLMTASVPSLIAFLAIAAPTPPDITAAIASGTARPT